MKFLMNKTLATYLKGLILIFGVIIFMPEEGQATHIVGGDITYKKIGTNRFRLTLSLRRDCSKNPGSGIDENEPFDSRAVITGFQEQANGSFAFLQEYTIDKNPSQDVDGKIESNCGFEGTQICYQQTQYEVDVTLLPNSSGGYTFTYQRCCRNGSINNVVNPLETGATFSVYIPKEAWSDQGNSSPYFAQWPDVYICGGQDFNYINQAIDPDGDSLVYKLCTPKLGFTKEKPRHAANNKNSPPPYTDLTWQPPYNLNNLMGGTPLKIDPKTGLMTARPLSVEGQYVIGVCVEEWRNGKKIGEIRRDFQYNVRICTTPPTAIYEAPDKVCDVKTVGFTNNSLASNSYAWNFNFPSNDPQFLSTEKSPTFTFPENGTYDVRLIVVRGSDKCSDTLTKSIRLTDLPYNADFDYDILSCNPDGSSTITLTDNSMTTDTGQVSTSWMWTLIQNGVPQTSTVNPGVFTINEGDFNVNLKVGASNACRGDTTKDVVFDQRLLQSDFKIELDGCDPLGDLRVKLIDLSQKINNDAGNSYIISESNWTVNSNGQDYTATGDTAFVTIPRASFTVDLDINTNKQCRAADSESFDISKFIPTADFNFNFTGCDENNLALIKLTENSNDNTQFSSVQSYNWVIDNNNYVGQVVDLTTQLKDTLNATLTLQFRNTCRVSIDSIFDINEYRPKVNFDYTPLDCPSNNEVRLEFGFNDKDVNGQDNNGINWNIGILSDVKPYTGNTIIVTVPKDSLVTAAVFTQFKNGCRDIISNQFLPGPFATIHLIGSNDTLCPNEEKIIFTNRNPDFTYTWTPAADIITTDTSFILKATKDQTYTVLVEDKLLCNATDSIIIEVLETINIDIAGPQNTCDGSVDLEALGAVGPGVYQWSTNPTFNTIINEGPKLDTNFTTVEQTYYVRFKGDVCSANDASLKVFNQTPRLDVLSPFPICIGDTIKTLNVENVGGHNLTINWKTDPHLISGETTLTPVVGTISDNDTDFTLYISTISQFNCPYNDSVQFIIRENPVVDFDVDVTNCDSFKVCFNLVQNPTDPYLGFLLWSFGDQSQDILNEKQLCHYYADSGSYKVVLRNLSERCPFDAVEKIIPIGAEPSCFENPNDVDCINSDYTLALPSCATGKTFKWTDIFGNTISTEANPEVNIQSDTSFFLNITDQYGCDYNDTINIKAFVFDFEIEVPDTVCQTGLYEINTLVTGGFAFNYVWSPANAIVEGGDTGSPLVDVSKAANYVVTVTYPALGCATTDNIVFNKFVFDYELVEPPLYCEGSTADVSIEVSGTPNYIYQWSPSNLILSGANTSNVEINVVDDTEIKILVKHPTLNCELRDSFFVNAPNLVVEVEAEPNGEVPKGKVVDIFVVDPEAGNVYIWDNNFEGTTQKVTILNDTVFVVTVTDENGCTGEAEVRIKIRLPICEEDVFIPTAFSPNGDAVNNTLMVRSNYISDMELIIYNRWGQEVFATKDISRGWDGKLNGQELSPDTYAYWLRAKCTDGADIIKKGSISLLR